jgi:hypothetical protein
VRKGAALLAEEGVSAPWWRVVGGQEMTSKIQGTNGAAPPPVLNESKTPASAKTQGATFGSVLSGVADVALVATSAVAPFIPGGQLVGMAAQGLSQLKGQQPGGLAGGGPQDQVDKMWAMQKENQVFNMQYMQLQQHMQADNRNYSTMSNLMKSRHDTAKAAINNMHA